MYEKEIEQQKRNIVEMVHANRIEAHLSPAMAMMEIFNVLLRDIMNIENGIDDERSDRLVLSNGHIALGLYAVFQKKSSIRLESGIRELQYIPIAIIHRGW